MRRLMVSILLACALMAHAQDEDNARRMVAAIEGVLKQRPDDPALWFYMSRFQAALADKRAAVAALEKVDELGDGFLPPRTDFANVWDDAAFQAVRARMEARLPRLDYAPTAFELQDNALIPEGIAFDLPSRSFFVGSIAQRKVVRISESGEAADFSGPRSGLDAVLGIAADAPRRRLYVVSTSALTAEGQKSPRNAVFEFDIDSRRLLNRYEVAAARQLNDVAVAPGGRVFATDSAAGAIYEIAIKGPGPSRQLLAPGQLGGSNGIAASADGAKLYVAHSTGLAVIDIASGKMQRVANRTRENIYGIDGLYAWQGQLIGVQSLTNPGRVVLVSLSPDGLAVTRVQTMLSHHHNALEQPTTGAITDRGFFLLAATGVSRYTREGTIRDPASVPSPTVLRIPLPR